MRLKSVLFLFFVLTLGLGFEFEPCLCEITHLYEDNIVSEIKRNLAYFAVSDQNCAGCASSVIPIWSCQEIIERNFLIIARRPNCEGGEEICIVIDSEPKKYFKLWMYPLEDGIYQMRLLKEISAQPLIDRKGKGTELFFNNKEAKL